ncbi:MAG: hypothetical protein V3U57_05715 [Robiginitomaculum sp.]
MMKLPNLDFIKIPEFRKDAENIDSYPKVSEAQQKPTDLREDKAWDSAAKRVIQKREEFVSPEKVTSETLHKTLSKMQEFAQKAEAYKLDDPQ